MHSDEQTADTELRLPRRFFLNVITGQIIYLVDNQIPPSKIKVANTEIHTLDACVCYYILKSLSELQVYIVEYSSHQPSQPLTPYGN